MRFLLGIGEAVIYPASNRLVASWIPTAERGVANGFIFAGVGAGAGITPPLITYILVNWGWQWSFYGSALIGGSVGVVWHVLARNSPREHPWIDERETAHIDAGLSAPKRAAEAHIVLAWRRVFRSREIGLLTLSYFTYGYSAFIFFSWFYIYLSKVRGLELKSSAFYSVLPFLAMAIGSPAGGWIADAVTRRYGRRVVRHGRIRPRGSRAVHCGLNSGSERAARQCFSNVRRRIAVPGAEFVLGGHCRYRWASRGVRFRPYEHGCANRWCRDRNSDAYHRGFLGLAGFLSDRGRPVFGRSSRLAPREAGRPAWW